MNPGNLVRCIHEKSDPRYPKLGLVLNAVYVIETVHESCYVVSSGAGSDPILAAKSRFILWEPQEGDWCVFTKDKDLTPGWLAGKTDTTFGECWKLRFEECLVAYQLVLVDGDFLIPILGRAPKVDTMIVGPLPEKRSFSVGFDTTQNRLQTLEKALKDDPCPDPAMIKEYQFLTSGKESVHVEGTE